jgi:hypothetical protein
MMFQPHQVSPLVPAVALLFFAIGYIVWKYLVLYIYVRKYETGAWCMCIPGLCWKCV